MSLRVSLGLALLLASTGTASAQIYTNHYPLAVADAPAGGGVGRPSLYPSVVAVPAPPNPTFTVQHVKVRLNNVVHPRLADLDVLLVPPAASGRPAVLLLSDTGSNVSSSYNGGIEFVDGVRTYVPANPSNGYEYRPTDAAPADLFPDAPAGPVTNDLDDLLGMNPTGDWSLYVVDDQTGQVGAIGQGWTLTLTVGPTYSSTGGAITITSPALPGEATLTAGSTITVGGLSGLPTSADVRLNGLTHTRPDDLEIYLRGPNGQCYLLQSDAGGTTPVSNLSYRISMYGDYITQPNADPLLSGTVEPTRRYMSNPADLEVPPPAGCTNPSEWFSVPSSETYVNGAWTLYLGDDAPGEDGSLVSWDLHFGIEQRSTGSVNISGDYSITTPNLSRSLSGTIYTSSNSVPAAAVRWRLRIDNDGTSPSTGVPLHYAESAWVPLTSNNWTLPDVPLHWGTGAIFVDVLDIAGNVRLYPDSVSINLPRPRYTLSEGATSTFFDLDVTVFNPTDQESQAEVTFLRQGAAPIVQTLELGPKGRRRLAVNTIPGLESGQISTMVRPVTVTPLIVERTMFWDERRYGGHAANAVEPSISWYFAEGAQNGFFRTYLLVANPNDTPLRVSMEFQIEGSTSDQPLRKQLTVGPNTRETVDIGGIPELNGQTFGARLYANDPFVAERAMYFSNRDRLWEGGHESTGVPDAAYEWLLAEGATGEFFETYVLVSNPSSSDTTVKLEFLLPNGAIIPKSYPLKGYGRLSVNVEHEHPWLAADAVATRVTSDRTRVVAERAMYWPGLPHQWTEAHNGFGLTTFRTKWGLADGRIGGSLGYATYILLANPKNEPASVDVLFVRDNGERFTVPVTVGANSRVTVDTASELPISWLQDGAEFSNVITSTVAIGVERATYWSSTDGLHWAGGANVQGTPIP